MDNKILNSNEVHEETEEIIEVSSEELEVAQIVLFGSCHCSN